METFKRRTPKELQALRRRSRKRLLAELAQLVPYFRDHAPTECYLMQLVITSCHAYRQDKQRWIDYRNALAALAGGHEQADKLMKAQAAIRDAELAQAKKEAA